MLRRLARVPEPDPALAVMSFPFARPPKARATYAP